MLPAGTNRVSDTSEAPAVSVAKLDFDQIYQDNFASLYRSARALGVQVHHIDDLLQEVFIVVHRRLKDFEGRSTIKTWLFGILWNCVCLYRRRRYQERRNTFTDEEPTSTDLSPHEQLVAKQAEARAAKLLEVLDADQRAVFIMAELEELSAPEIAEIVGAPLNTVYSRLRLARKKVNMAATNLTSSSDDLRLSTNGEVHHD